jgi:hypothetical protein
LGKPIELQKAAQVRQSDTITVTHHIAADQREKTTKVEAFGHGMQFFEYTRSGQSAYLASLLSLGSDGLSFPSESSFPSQLLLSNRQTHPTMTLWEDIEQDFPILTKDTFLCFECFAYALSDVHTAFPSDDNRLGQVPREWHSEWTVF